VTDESSRKNIFSALTIHAACSGEKIIMSERENLRE
jgi:hypothetical protein